MQANAFHIDIEPLTKKLPPERSVRGANAETLSNWDDTLEYFLNSYIITDNEFILKCLIPLFLVN